MIITRKKFEEAMEKVRAEEQSKYEKWASERDEKRWNDERINELDKRMSRAFNDIARRLTELEKQTTAPHAVAAYPYGY
jgi:4-diphosphocytidyl-2C-methyl-D-erythritol kinase